jgi:hypothetical protein
MSLARALAMLGLRTLHNDMKRLNDILDGSTPRPDFRRYDDVDAVVDLPSAWFFEELLDAYPEAKCILTVRDEDSWWESVSAHTGEIFTMTAREREPVRWDLRLHAYGSADPREFTYRKRYREHNARVRAVVPPERLLVLDIVGGDGWQPLCRFLDLPVPAEPFPHGNVRAKLRQIAPSLRPGGE